MNSPSINLSTHIEEVVNLLRWEELSEVVLCGHSYGGAVISGAADRIPERLRALIYLDAFVLHDGECVFDLVPPEQVAGMRESAKTDGDGWKVAPIPAVLFCVNEADRDWVDRQCTPQSLACFEEPLRLTGGLDRVRDVTHIRAEGFREGSPFGPCHERAKAKGWKTQTVHCGHDVMVDQPEELTSLLLTYV